MPSGSRKTVSPLPRFPPHNFSMVVDQNDDIFTPSLLIQLDVLCHTISLSFQDRDRDVYRARVTEVDRLLPHTGAGSSTMS